MGSVFSTDEETEAQQFQEQSEEQVHDFDEQQEQSASTPELSMPQSDCAPDVLMHQNQCAPMPEMLMQQIQSAPPLRMQQNQCAPDLLMQQNQSAPSQAQAGPPPQPMRAQMGARRMSRRTVSSFDAPEYAALPETSFNDDDPMPIGEAAACDQPEPDPAVSTDCVLTVSTRVEYSALPRGQTQDVFGLITIQAAAAPVPDPSAPSQTAEQERQPMDLICVLDVSGSMRGSKIQQVQDATRFLVEQATPKDRISIVTFNSDAARPLRLRKMDADGKNSANVATYQLHAGGGTSIAAGLSMALSVMEQRRQRNKVSSILLLTDGQDGSTRHQLPALIARAQQANCSVYAFGFGSDHDAALLSELAEQAQTPFTFVEDTSKIRECFAGAVGGLTSIVAQGIELTIAGHVPVKHVHTPFTMQRHSETSVTITIPDVFAGERRDVLVELAVPAADAGGHAKLLESYVRYTDLRSEGVVQTSPVVMETSLVEEPQPEAEPDEEVSAQRERVEVTRALQEAAAQSDRGQFEEAQRVLGVADNRLKSKKMKSHLSEALGSELADAQDRMRSRSMWEGAGRAEVIDGLQMHKMQRCTNMMSSASSKVQKSSKQMYCNATQSAWVSKSKFG
jgi:Mg-chelatase subunit ChlD